MGFCNTLRHAANHGGLDGIKGWFLYRSREHSLHALDNSCITPRPLLTYGCQPLCAGTCHIQEAQLHRLRPPACAPLRKREKTAHTHKLHTHTPTIQLRSLKCRRVCPSQSRVDSNKLQISGSITIHNAMLSLIYNLLLSNLDCDANACMRSTADSNVCKRGKTGSEVSASVAVYGHIATNCVILGALHHIMSCSYNVMLSI